MTNVVVDKPILTVQAEQVLLGSLLGDSGIYRQTIRGKPYINMTQGEVQLEYLMWKAGFIPEWFKGALWQQKGGFAGSKQVYHLRLRSSEQFVPFMVKDEAYLNAMGPLAWAIWYQDDGHIRSAQGLIMCYARISHFKWGREFCQLACSVLMSKFGIGAQVFSKGIAFTAEGSRMFFDLIKDYICPMMAYKMPSLLQRSFP